MSSEALVPAGQLPTEICKLYPRIQLEDVFHNFVEVAEHPLFNEFVDRMGESENGIKAFICMLRVYRLFTEMFPSLTPQQKIFLMRTYLDGPVATTLLPVVKRKEIQL